jgi:hypothetical protein
LASVAGCWEDAFRSEEVAVKRDSTPTVGMAATPVPATHREGHDAPQHVLERCRVCGVLFDRVGCRRAVRETNDSACRRSSGDCCLTRECRRARDGSTCGGDNDRDWHGHDAASCHDDVGNDDASRDVRADRRGPDDVSARARGGGIAGRIDLRRAASRPRAAHR